MSDTEISEEDTIAACAKLESLDWIRIGELPYVMKYRLEEDGFTMTVSDLVDVYGEYLDKETFLYRFNGLNPFAEMPPNVILKNLKLALENIVSIHPILEETTAYLTYETNKGARYYFDMIFVVNNERLKFFYEVKILPMYQFAKYVMKPTLFKSLILDAENAVLKGKVAELEARYRSSSSSGCSERKDVKPFYTPRTQSESQKIDIFDAFSYLLKEIKIKTEIFDPDDLLSTEGCTSTSTSSSLYNRHDVRQVITAHIKDEEEGDTSTITSSSLHNRQNAPQVITTYIRHEEDKPEVSISHNVVVKAEDSAISPKIEQFKNDDSDDGGNSNNLPAKRNNINVLNNPISIKREIVEEDIKEENASKSPPYLKPSPAKKQKYLRF